MSQEGLLKKISGLFFVKRRPHTHVPLEWRKPPTAKEYEDLLEWEGLVSIANWKNDDLNQYPLLKQDLADLEQHLLPAFWEFNQKAKHYQNRYYLYQWVFMLGAFVTTLLGALTTYAYTLDSTTSLLPNAFGILTAIISAITAFFNALSTQNSPQTRWAKSRRLAEELRMAYFKYLAHLDPYTGEDRVQKLRQNVLQIRRKETENG